MATRPIIKLALKPIDRVLEILAICVLSGTWIFSFWAYSRLPDIIPVHFDFDGTPNDYGSRGTFFTLPAIGIGVYVLITMISRYPHLFNYPKQVTEENAERLYSMSTTMMRYLKTAVLVIFGTISVDTYSAAINKDTGFMAWGMPLEMALMLGPLIFTTIKMARLK
jgi:uncharacterized membrane protein